MIFRIRFNFFHIILLWSITIFAKVMQKYRKKVQIQKNFYTSCFSLKEYNHLYFN